MRRRTSDSKCELENLVLAGGAGGVRLAFSRLRDCLLDAPCAGVSVAEHASRRLVNVLENSQGLVQTGTAIAHDAYAVRVVPSAAITVNVLYEYPHDFLVRPIVLGARRRHSARRRGI